LGPSNSALVANYFCNRYFFTFFSPITAPSYTVELYKTGNTDEQMFNAAFTNRLNYIKLIHEEVKQWVADNIERWKEEGEEWFEIDMIPDQMMPSNLSIKRRISRATSFRESLGITNAPAAAKYSAKDGARNNDDYSNRAKVTLSTTVRARNIVKWETLAEKLFDARANNYKSNIVCVRRVFEENGEMFAPLLDRCPSFIVILSYVLEDRLGLRVRKVDWTLKMNEWGDVDCKRVGCSLATFLRSRKTGEVALAAWRLHYPPLNELFEQVSGFEEFMSIIANNTLRER